MRKIQATSEDNMELFKAAVMSILTNNMTNSLSYMDLHGMSVEQAKAYVFKHVKNACVQGMHYCRIITGRGNHVNAKGERGVIFDACETWLKSEELKCLIERYEKKIGHYIVRLKSPNSQLKDIEENEEFCAKYLANIQAKAANDAEAQYELACCYSAGFGKLKANPTVAFKWYLTAARQGHQHALAQVGHCYLTGEGVRQSDQLAIEWFTKAANKNHANSAYTLSSIYLWGWGTDVDHNLALSWVAKSANWGDIMGMRRMGGFFNQGTIAKKDPEKAYEWYRRAAILGDAYSQYQIGMFHHIGIGTTVNTKKSFDWILLAAQGGDTDAMMMLGNFYLNGEGCEKNIEEGFIWLKKADNFGHAHASFFMGKYYLEQNKEKEALSFLEKSAENGSILAQSQLFGLKHHDPTEQDKLLALLIEQPIHEIIEKLSPQIQMALGSLMLNSTSSNKKTKQNQQKGVIVLELAARSGQAMAYNALGFYFSRKNLKKAAKYWQQGADANNVDAMFMYGLYLELYANNAKNQAEAMILFEKAAKADHPGALFRLGIKIFFQQEWTDEGLEKTHNYLQLAMEQANRQLALDIPDFVSSYMVLYKTLHAVGVFLTCINGFSSQRGFDEHKNKLAAHEYFRQSAKMGYNKAQFDLGIALIEACDTFQEGINWLNKAAKQEDERAKQVMMLYRQYSNLPHNKLEQFNVQVGSIIEQSSSNDLIGFSKNDFNKITAAYFGDDQNTRSDNTNQRKGKVPAKTEKVTPAKKKIEYPNSTQSQQEIMWNSPKKTSELVIESSSLFHRAADSACSIIQDKEDILSSEIELESSGSLSDEKTKETQESSWWCNIQ